MLYGALACDYRLLSDHNIVLHTLRRFCVFNASNLIYLSITRTAVAKKAERHANDWSSIAKYVSNLITAFSLHINVNMSVYKNSKIIIWRSYLCNVFSQVSHNILMCTLSLAYKWEILQAVILLCRCWISIRLVENTTGMFNIVGK